MNLDDEDEHCPSSLDHSHCHCWWEGDACCRCGDPDLQSKEAMTREEVDRIRRGIADRCTAYYPEEFWYYCIQWLYSDQIVFAAPMLH